MTVVSVGVSRHPCYMFMSALKPVHVEHKSLNPSASDYLLTCQASFAFNRQMKWTNPGTNSLNKSHIQIFMLLRVAEKRQNAWPFFVCL